MSKPFKPHKCPLCLGCVPPKHITFTSDRERTQHNTAVHPQENGMRPKGVVTRRGPIRHVASLTYEPFRGS